MENLLTKLSPELQAKVYEACPPSTQATMDNHARKNAMKGATTGAIVFGAAGAVFCTTYAPLCIAAGIVGGGLLGGGTGHETGLILGAGQAAMKNWESDEVCVADTVARLTKRPAPAATR
jgi:hypothetical protein